MRNSPESLTFISVSHTRAAALALSSPWLLVLENSVQGSPPPKIPPWLHGLLQIFLLCVPLAACDWAHPDLCHRTVFMWFPCLSPPSEWSSSRAEIRTWLTMNCSIYNHTGHRMLLVSASQKICECRIQLSESPRLGYASIFKTEIQS